LTQTVALDALDKRLLNLLQSDFPLAPAPFAALAERLRVGEDEVLTRARRLRKAGILRHLSAIFDAYRLGYRSTLVALSVPAERLDEGAAIVSAHPAVSHNYGREHRYNLWFVLAVAKHDDLEGTVADLARSAGAASMMILPALKLFKIDVELDMEGNSGKASYSPPPEAPRRELSGEEITLVRALQEDIPIVSRPFVPAAVALGMGEEELLARARALRDEGIMRRFAAVLHHRRAGFLANGMVCWLVPNDRVEEIGRRFASYPQVTHCYQRPTYPDWPYNVFTMIHARTRQD